LPSDSRQRCIGAHLAARTRRTMQRSTLRRVRSWQAGFGVLIASSLIAASSCSGATQHAAAQLPTVRSVTGESSGTRTRGPGPTREGPGAASGGPAAPPLDTTLGGAQSSAVPTTSVRAGRPVGPTAVSSSGKSAIPEGAPPSRAAGTGAAVLVFIEDDPNFGRILADGSGHPLYFHDSGAQCTTGCTAAWMPLLVPPGGEVNGGTALKAELATVTRPDGAVQVTYLGQPLYRYSRDPPTGAVTGDGVGGWHVAVPSRR
jgi:predicted lipoprotein with Yx(FWY)xxD motif